MTAASRALGLFCLAYAALGLNVSAILVYGPLYIGRLRPESAELLIGLLFAVPSLTAFLGHNFWGALYDRVRSPRPFVMLSLATETIFFGLLLATDSAGMLVALTSVFSFFSTAMFPAAQAWSTLAWEDAKGRVIGKLHAAESVGWAGGMVAAAAAFWWHSQPGDAVRLLFGCCLVCSCAIFVLVTTSFPRLERPAAMPSGRSLLADLALLYRRREMLWLAAFLFLLSCSNVAFFAYFSVYLCQYLGGPEPLLSASMTVATVAGALLFPVYGWVADRWGRRTLLLFSTLAYFGFYASLCAIRSPWIVAALYTIPLYPAMKVGAYAWLADITDERDRAGGMGLLEGVASLASVVGPVFGWAFVSRFGYGVLPLVPMLLLAGGVITLLLLRYHRDTTPSPYGCNIRER